jgi:hypothetical protein
MELELFMLVFCIKQLKPYLLGRFYTVHIESIGTSCTYRTVLLQN